MTQTMIIISILLLVLAPFGITYDEDGDEEGEKFFQCEGEMEESNRVRLYLGLDNLVVDCMLRRTTMSSIQYRNQLELYTSADLLPTVEIYNSTNTLTFTFSLSKVKSTWQVNIPRKNLTINTVSAPVDEWYVEFNMFHGMSMFVSPGSMLEPLKGTLVDIAREPILQWTIGEEFVAKDVVPHLKRVVNLEVSQSPCASDVAVLAPVFPPGGHTGVILSVTRSAFTSEARWFNVTRTLCGLINEVCVSGCVGISIVNVMLTNTHLFLLTNRGLFISQDLLSPASRPLKFTLLFLPALAQMDYSSTTMWFSSQCCTDRLYFNDDIISLINNEGEGDNLNSRCVYSEYPFTKWSICRASNAELKKNARHRYLSFLHDRHQNTGLLLSYTEEGAMVSVFGSKPGSDTFYTRTKFPPVQISFVPKGVIMMNNHVILYGSEVWTSTDRGSSFKWVFTLRGEVVVEAVTCSASGVVVFSTEQGHLYIMKSGQARYAWLDETVAMDSSLVCDHMDILMSVQLDPNSPTGLRYRTIDMNEKIQEHRMSFDRPLALQYTTDHTVLLHVHRPIENRTVEVNSQAIEHSAVLHTQFSLDHVGKVIYFSDGGMVVITEVFLKHYFSGFDGMVAGEILVPIRAASLTDEPIQHCDLLVIKTDTKGFIVNLVIQSQDPALAFNSSHIGKTVVSPGYSSYIILSVLEGGVAVAKPTMPALVQPQTMQDEGHWLLFSAMGTENWVMKEGPCRHALQSMDDMTSNALIRINVREQLKFTFKAFMADHSVSMVYKKKFMFVVLTNPLAIRVTASHSWDYTNNHILTLTAFSHLCRKATTTVTVFIPEASLLCDSSSFTFTLQNSCPEGLSIVYLRQEPISEHEWLFGDPRDELDNKRLFDLPVNYRPPSELGVLIPTTDNIYNADPSKPRPREHYHISKNSGRFKHCAGKKTLEECGCTDDLRVSPLTINSDCRQRVLRMIYPVTKFNFTLFLRRTNHPDRPLMSPYFVTVTEVNNRSSWSITSSETTPTVARMRRYLSRLNETLYNPNGLQISLFGSELFHFRITVIPGVVLCDLVDEVQIYVDEPPLAFPTHYLINNMTAILLGGLLLVGFLLNYNGVSMPTKSRIQTMINKRKASVAPATTDSSTLN
ncbi:cation channel sperm-associated auxiliary subunit beta-like [Osmerus eperlanus]|uniref:cation channel sperm-associated auxiliary subunit beta-like n=1 Tax=Osmerus eperlanus TaxID=29151 RepID=UPI002E0D6E65